MSRLKSGVVDVPLTSMWSSAPEKLPIDSSVPSMPLMVSRSACANSYEPLMALVDGWSAAQGPNCPRAVTWPVGLGLVIRALKRTGRSKAASVSDQVVDLERARRSIRLARFEGQGRVDGSQRVDDNRGRPVQGPVKARRLAVGLRRRRVGSRARAPLGQEDLQPVQRHRVHMDWLAQDGQDGHRDGELLHPHQRREAFPGRLVMQHEATAHHLHFTPEQDLEVRQLDAGAQLVGQDGHKLRAHARHLPSIQHAPRRAPQWPAPAARRSQSPNARRASCRQPLTTTRVISQSSIRNPQSAIRNSYCFIPPWHAAADGGSGAPYCPCTRRAG